MTSPYRAHNSKASDHSDHAFNSMGIKRAGSDPQDSPEPLTTSKLGNQKPQVGGRQVSIKKVKTATGSGLSIKHGDSSAIDGLLAKLSEQQAALKQKQAAPEPERVPSLNYKEHASSSSSVSLTPASDRGKSSLCSDSANDVPNAEQVVKLKRQLAEAEQRIALMDQELATQTRNRRTVERVIGPSSELDVQVRGSDDVSIQDISTLQNNLNASTRAPVARHAPWSAQGDSRSDTNEPSLLAGQYNSSAQIWGQRNSFGPDNSGASEAQYHGTTQPWSGNTGRPVGNMQVRGANFVGQTSTQSAFSTNAVNVPVAPPNAPMPLRWDTRNLPAFVTDPHNMAGPADLSMRRQNPPSRSGSAFDPRLSSWAPFPPVGVTQSDGHRVSPSATPLSINSTATSFNSAHPNMMIQPVNNYVRPAGTRLSPTASEFSIDTMGNPWNPRPGSDVSSPVYYPTTEPLNYRRLLERNASCDWSYIVDKIVCNNEQQASIFLQQKLKNATPEHKYDIVQAIIAQAYPLMINRFGNFLVQRCFEHGTSEQVIAIANAIRGKTLELSMDSFGCHVIQKAFDCVPENYKAIMVHELLRQIPETVVHRYACHVWQKLFELRWSDSPPQIMKYVNEALRGMWHEVALGETGSLVVQNIFENCLEEDKRPCINEVLASIDVISHGQFGNWCIQHICEHGAPSDKARATDHILRYATEYSMDQYASKVIEKCLKIGGDDFLNKYLDRVCEARPDRPRMPLIDIAGDQFGNYLIQWILSHANPQNRETVATHVRKHMVSLRGSKYGSRVAMLCNNPMSATRPGPPAGMQLHRYSNNNNNNGNSNGIGGMNTRSTFGGYR